MYYHLEPVTNNKKPYLIVFVHGLVGGRHTWIRNDKRNSILNYLYANPTLRANFDFAVFSYYTKFSDVISRLIYFVKRIYLETDTQYHENLTIEQIARILRDALKNRPHKKVILVGHSMGGLVAKSTILQMLNEQTMLDNIISGYTEKLKLLEESQLMTKLAASHPESSLRPSDSYLAQLSEEKQMLERSKNETMATRASLPAIPLYISLAVPHQGSNIAMWATMLLRSKQIANLSPLNADRNKINLQWIKTPASSLPKTIYFQGLNDRIVPETSSEGYDVRRIQVISSADDHFSIVCPQNNQTSTLNIIKHELQALCDVEQLKDDEDDLSLPIANQPKTRIRDSTRRPRLKWVPVIVTAMLIGIGSYWIVMSIWPSTEAKKARIAEKLGLRTYDGIKNGTIEGKICDLYLPLDKQPAHVKDFIPEKWVAAYVKLPNSVQGGPGSFEIVAEDNYQYTIEFIPPADTACVGFVIRVEENLIDAILEMESNQEWRRHPGNPEMLYSIKCIGDRMQMIVPKSIL